MSITLIERETAQPHIDVLIESDPEKQLIVSGLGAVIAEQRLSDDTDERIIAEAEAIRRQMGDDILKIDVGKPVGERTYTASSRFIIEQAVAAGQQMRSESRELVREVVAPKVTHPEYNWLYDATSTHKAAAVRPTFHDL